MKDMQSLTGSFREDAPITMEALIAVKPSEGEEGAFRFLLAGPDNIRLLCPVTKVLDDKRFAGMSIEAILTVGDQVILLQLVY